MKLSVVAAAKSISYVVVPGIGQRPEFRMTHLLGPERQLLCDFDHETAAGSMLFEDPEQFLHRLELQLADVSGTIAAQFPIVCECQIYLWTNHLSDQKADKNTRYPQVSRNLKDESKKSRSAMYF